MNPRSHKMVNHFAPGAFETSVKVFHELMACKIKEILLISTPYDAFIMEEDGSLTSKIIHEYQGLNLSSPPRLTKAFSAKEALEIFMQKNFDLVITMPGLEDMETYPLVMQIKSMKPELPVILLAHSPQDIDQDISNTCKIIDNEFIWTGNSDLLLALIKHVEDSLNVEADTKNGMVRVLILVEDSPFYRSFFLPLIYRAVVKQIRSVLEESLTQEHQLLKMRARPKILVAENFEKALYFFERFRPYVFGIMSDTRFPKDCKITADAGVLLLSHIKKEIPHLPLLLMSSEPENKHRAEDIQAVFIDKNAHDLYARIENFFLNYLGFGDFVFRLPDKTEIGRASNLRSLEKILLQIPDEPVEYNARRHRFSNWLMARSELALASEFAKVEVSDFDSIEKVKHYIVSTIHCLRKCRQKGVVVQFDSKEFDPDISDFVKIGKGSLGGKARGLAFMSSLLHQVTDIAEKYPEINILVPKTLVIATDGFESFISLNNLHYLLSLPACAETDREIQARFLKAEIPGQLYNDLKLFLEKVRTPLSVRSSSLMEDAHFQSYSGLYKTYMIPNNHPDISVRLHHLATAVKLVYASTYFEKPRNFAKNISFQFQEDSMAVIIQQLAGRQYGDFFYPSISGKAQSWNFYPFSYMKPEDGIARIALGFGEILEQGEIALRFSPSYPHLLPQFSSVEDILAYSQRFFYALRIDNYPESLDIRESGNLEKRDVHDAEDEFSVKSLCSTYIPEENRIRDTAYIQGLKILTFAPVLKYNILPLPELLKDILELGHKGMGSPVEIEFSVNLGQDKQEKPSFFLLQLRPMSAGKLNQDVQISRHEIKNALCFSNHALGHGSNQDIKDIVFVKPGDFDPKETMAIANEIGQINEGLIKKNRPYLLIGPGRWGSSDRWLGIPVQWIDISGVNAIIEVKDPRLPAEPSQGSHFFQKITGLGIHYITLDQNSSDYIDWPKLYSIPRIKETRFLCHVRHEKPLILKNDGRNSCCVILTA